MKALKDCSYIVYINQDLIDGKYIWAFCASSGSGIYGYVNGNNLYKKKQGAINNFKKFAELNNITNYTIIGE